MGSFWELSKRLLGQIYRFSAIAFKQIYCFSASWLSWNQSGGNPSQKERLTFHYWESYEQTVPNSQGTVLNTTTLKPGQPQQFRKIQSDSESLEGIPEKVLRNSSRTLWQRHFSKNTLHSLSDYLLKTLMGQGVGRGCVHSVTMITRLQSMLHQG